MMSWLTTRNAAVALMAATLWVIPSVGTQGMGSLRQLVRHPDRTISGSEPAAQLPDGLLARADGIAARAVVGPARTAD